MYEALGLIPDMKERKREREREGLGGREERRKE
jgi:hypothetical protein